MAIVLRVLAVSLLILTLPACSPSMADPSGPRGSAPTFGWEQLGGPLDVDAGASAHDAAVVVDRAGAPVVAWSESGRILVKRWTGDGWQLLGDGSEGEPVGFSYRPALSLDAAGQPIVAWQQDAGQGRDVYVKRWTGLDWQTLGGVVDRTANLDATSPSLGCDRLGRPLVAFREQPAGNCQVHVVAWTGGAWHSLGGPLNLDPIMNAVRPTLGVAPQYDPVVAWYEWDGTSNNILVSRWTGDAWQVLGGPLDMELDQGAYNPALAVNGAGLLAVTWREYDGVSDNVYVKVWTGETWRPLGAALDVEVGDAAELPRIAVGEDGTVVVAWEERAGADYSVYVKRWTGDGWDLLGGALDMSEEANAYNPALAIDADGRIVVAWEEVVGGQRDVYVKRFSGGY